MNPSILKTPIYIPRGIINIQDANKSNADETFFSLNEIDTSNIHISRNKMKPKDKIRSLRVQVSNKKMKTLGQVMFLQSKSIIFFLLKIYYISHEGKYSLNGQWLRFKEQNIKNIERTVLIEDRRFCSVIWIRIPNTLFNKGIKPGHIFQR